MVKEELKEYCNSLNLDTIGFVKCRVFDELRDFYNYRKQNNLENEFEEADIEKRINPMCYMEGGKNYYFNSFSLSLGWK